MASSLARGKEWEYLDTCRTNAVKDCNQRKKDILDLQMDEVGAPPNANRHVDHPYTLQVHVTQPWAPLGETNR
eukprot:3324309-Amphidinium_carterae.1